MDESFNLECLKAHNDLRSLHKAPPLKLSIQLAEDSQICSDNIARKIKPVKKKSNYLFGENKSFSNYKQSGEEITLKWYKEVYDFKFGQERQNLAAICHFAQIVWKETSEIGFGRSKSEDGQWIVVARYIKPGNIVGKFLNNVQHRIIGWENSPMIIKLKVIDFNNFPTAILNNQSSNFVNFEKKMVSNNNTKDDMNRNSEQNSRNDYLFNDNKKISLNFEENFKVNNNDKYDKDIESINKIKNINPNFLKSSEDKVLNYFKQNKFEEKTQQLLNEQKFVTRNNEDDLQGTNSETNSTYSSLISHNKTTDFKNYSHDPHIIHESLINIESSSKSVNVTGKSNDLPDNTSLKFSQNDNLSVSSNEIYSKPKSFTKKNKIKDNTKENRFQTLSKEEKIDSSDVTKNHQNKKSNEINLTEETIQPNKVVSECANLDLKNGNNGEEVSSERKIDDFRNIILKVHNEYRKQHKVKTLKLNQELEELAQNWADYISTTNQVGYSNKKYKENEVGENIVLQLRGSLSSFIDKMVCNWYQEQENFHYGIEPKNVDDIGHFSQVVWAKTKEIGIGISTTSRYSVIVCFYFPPGNIKGEFVENIKPTSSR